MAHTLRPFSHDVGYFVRRSPYLFLKKPDEAARFLRRQLEIADECLPALAAYPKVLIEPLEFFYTCLRSLGALDQPFFEVLLSEHTWRGAVWGAWLAILDPREVFLPALRDVRDRWPHNDWLVECAESAIRGSSTTTEHDSVTRLGARCRELLRGVQRPVVPLRHEPTEVEVAQMKRETELVRSVYASGGAEAARALLPGTLLEFYTQDYPSWAARHIAQQPRK